MGSFRRLDDIAIADCALDVTAGTLDDLFATAARALVETMVDPATVPAAFTRTLSLEASTVELLLYDWLSELIFRKDAAGEVFPRCDVQVREQGGFRLDARLEGGAIEPGRTALRADAKGVTLHQFVVERAPEGWHARFVIDL